VPDDSLPTDLDALWRNTQERLRESVPESTYRLWLEPLKAVGVDAETLYLEAPEGIRAWAERRYSGLIAAALADSDSGLRQASFAAPREIAEGFA
jgi:chromosomal replication initiation ATPase DnaA